MKKSTILFFTFLIFHHTFSQDIEGQWNGLLKVQGLQLRVIFNVTNSEKGLVTTMDSPDQGVKGIPVTNTKFENPKIKFEVSTAGIEYFGELKDNEIIGTFKQGGQEFAMNLSKNVIEKEIVKRPQEPSKPYSYYSEEVIFENVKVNISLSGTLTLPNKEGVFPVVILISGSGPQNRDSELFGHKPFLLISDYLTKKGIAVLRYDDRGVGQSKGNFESATSEDFANDVESAITYLKKRKEINKKKIGLIGHSEGGIIAPIVASKSKDVNFIVLLAGLGLQAKQVLLLQQELIARASGVSDIEIQESTQNFSNIFEMIINSNDNEKLKKDLSKNVSEITKGLADEKSKENYNSLLINQMTSPWMVYFLKFNPTKVLEKVKCPVFAINGEKDLQVSAKENLEAIKKAITKGGNTNVTTKEFSNLNHLFQECNTGLPTEYATIEQTFSPIVLDEITMWILKITK